MLIDFLCSFTFTEWTVPFYNADAAFPNQLPAAEKGEHYSFHIDMNVFRMNSY